MALPRQYDVIILGGGLAGLTAALQMRQRRPETTILVADRRAHPVPEAAFKVGESTGELGAYYVSDILGFREHVQLRQLTKLGLRMFFSSEGNLDIGRRMELGPFEHLPVPAYQFDRGRLENFLGGECLRQGVHFLDDCRVCGVELGDESHRVTLLRGGKELTMEARWLVDGSGRTSILRRKLGLEVEVGHKASAAWFRIQDEIDLEDWSSEPVWRQRMLPGLRRFSTNHLMGPGYWVWLIPLASKATSVGIVIDEEMHSFQGIHRFEDCLEWLAKHEPQCATAVEERRHLLMDFLTVKHFAYSSSKVFSPDR
ncbi:MAG TPA: tryptophan 7-halogenase, partial [Thermoanaerobaculia bacterium]|nr:tryptophan 7-halogenase [Thermoanaerobaculia bacterium]